MKPHKNLKAWRDGVELVKEIFLITKQFPKEERYEIVSQLRRASLSVPLNIAEGAARTSSKEFVRFLDIAIGSIAELDTLFLICFELNFISAEEFNMLNLKLDLIGKMVYGLKKKILSQIP